MNEVIDQQAIEQTGDALTQMSQDLMAVDSQFLDGQSYSRDALIHQCQSYMRVAGEASLEIGRRLVVLKEHECRHGEFGLVLDQIGIARRTAQKFMQAAIKYANPNLRQLTEQLNYSKLVELMVLDDEELEALSETGTVLSLELDDIDRMSTTELRKELRKTKMDKEDDQVATDKLLSDKNKKIDELTRKLAEATSLSGRVEQWPEIVAEFSQDIAGVAQDAVNFIERTHGVLAALEDAIHDMPEEAKTALAHQAVNATNMLVNATGKLQHESSAFDLFLQGPIFELNDTDGGEV